MKRVKQAKQRTKVGPLGHSHKIPTIRNWAKTISTKNWMACPSSLAERAYLDILAERNKIPTEAEILIYETHDLSDSRSEAHNAATI
jgi:hypothetical protein